MSYLNPARLHFAGQFRADVSTVNNDPAHFDNATFTDSDRQMQSAAGANGWWQPQGTGAWRIDGCAITSAILGGESVDDPAVGLEIRDSGDRVSAKLVDLDPNQQMVSTIFGLEVRIVDPGSRQVLMRGSFEPAGFYDIWFGRGVGRGGDMGASAFFQSVLTGVQWGDIGHSPALQALRQASLDGRLSIKFMTDSYGMRLPNRGFGRFVGTIGPQLAGDPDHFTPGRYLAPWQPQLSNGPITAPIGYVGCREDGSNGKVIADFGNALLTDNDSILDIGALHLMVAYYDGNGRARSLDLGALENYTAPGWYERTAGIQAFPPDRALTADQMAIVGSGQLCVTAPLARTALFSAFAQEAPDGIYLRPDQFVYRMEPGTTQAVRVMATQFGQPLASATIDATVSAFGLQPNPGNDPPLAVPLDALRIADGGSIVTGPDGWATITLSSSDPGLPRSSDSNVSDGVDGQVYAVELRVAGAANSGSDFSGSCFVSILLFSALEIPETVAWSDARPIFRQYSNLYPRPHGPDTYQPDSPTEPPLHPVVNLSDEAQVTAYAPMIVRALQLPIGHPNHMPVTRDLSASRRGILLGWARGAAEAVPKLKGGLSRVRATKPLQAPDRNFAASRRSAAAAVEPPEELLGGKTAARQRMLRGAIVGKPEEK